MGTVEENPRAVYSETFVASDGETQRAYDLRVGSENCCSKKYRYLAKTVNISPIKKPKENEQQPKQLSSHS